MKARPTRMREVETGKLDATLADLPADHLLSASDFRELAPIGEPVGRGYYVIFVRRGDAALRDALDWALDKLLADGRLQQLYEKYGLWNESQQELASLGGQTRRRAGHSRHRACAAGP